MILASLTTHHQTRIESRCRSHAQDFPRRRLDGNHTTYLSFQQTLGQLLQFDVNPQSQILSRHGCFVQSTIHIPPLNTTTRIPEQDFHSLFTTQLFFIGTFYTLLAYKVTTHIIIISRYILLGNFRNISQNMGCRIIVILTDGSSLYIKPGKLEQLFLKNSTLFCRKLGHEYLVRIRRITGIGFLVLHFTDSALKILRCNT